MPAKRIAIGSIFTECNQLGGQPIDLAWFERYELHRGQDLLQVSTGVLGGMLQVLQENQAEIVPLIYASTSPGGSLTSECYTQLKGELLARLAEAGTVDGVLLPLHGAASVEHVDDLEGDLIKEVRQAVGPTTPLVVTLDLHAHVSADMVHFADAILAWETYPHRDAVSTGVRGARLLIDTLAGQCRPTMAMAKVPVITSAINGSTEGAGPFAQVMRLAKAHEDDPAVLSTSAILVHPYLDQPGMGSGALVITDDDIAQAIEIAQNLAEEYWKRRFELEPETYSPDEAIVAGLAVDGGPVLLVETADCCGGGAAGDSVATLAALIQADVAQPTLVPVVDPVAAAACHQAGIGETITTSLGHRLDPRWGQQITVTGQVSTLSDGIFRYSGGIWGGVEGDMGSSAVLSVGSLQVLITTHATYDWADEQFRAVQLDPAVAKFIVVKNPMNYQMAYEGVAKAAFILDTPGPTPATLRSGLHQRLDRPYFPLDEDFTDFSPTILR